jgi:Mg-chelatase subunit ChlD
MPPPQPQPQPQPEGEGEGEGQGESEGEGEGQGESEGEGEGESESEGEGESESESEAEGEGEGESESEAEGEGEGESESEAEGEGEGEGDGPCGPSGAATGQDATDGQSDSGETPEAAGDPSEARDGHGNLNAPTLDPDLGVQETVRRINQRAGREDADLDPNQDGAHRLCLSRNSESALPALPAGHHAHHAGQLDARMPGNSVLAGQIARLLVSEEVHRRTHHETSGRLDRRALVRMRAGAPDVFSRRDDTPGMDTALLVLVDGSASMAHPVDRLNPQAGNRMDMAQITAWQIAKAAELAGAKVAVAVFYSNPTLGADLQLVKPWHLPTHGSAGHIATMRPLTSTPLSPAILAGADMLATQTATRRIMLVLTDGQCDLGDRAVTAACNLAADMGVETVGVGMGCEEVVQAFPPRWSVNVQDLTRLATTGLGVIVDMLEDANQRGAD